MRVLFSILIAGLFLFSTSAQASGDDAPMSGVNEMK